MNHLLLFCSSMLDIEVIDRAFVIVSCHMDKAIYILKVLQDVHNLKFEMPHVPYIAVHSGIPAYKVPLVETIKIDANLCTWPILQSGLKHITRA